MKKFILKFKILPLIISAFLFSCNDDFNPATNDGDGGNNGGEPPIIEETEYGMGWIPAEESDWAGIPVITDVSSLADISSPQKTRNNRNIIINEDDFKKFKHFSQGSYGTCVASSFANAYALVEYNFKGMDLNGLDTDNNTLYEPFKTLRYSPAFLHYLFHKDEGTFEANIFQEGSTSPQIIKIINKYGIPTIADWPYEVGNLPIYVKNSNGNYIKDANGHYVMSSNFNKPTKEIEEKAQFNKTVAYTVNQESRYTIFKYDVEEVDKFKEAIDKGYPIIFGMHVPNISPMLNGGNLVDMSYFNNYINNNSILNKTYSGHAMTIIGYDESKQAFLVLNTWGWKNSTSTIGYGSDNIWGRAGNNYPGCFWLAYDVFESIINIPGATITPQRILRNFTIIGVPISAKKSTSSKIYEFNGFQNYKDVKYSEGATISSTGNYAFMRLDKKGNIEYPMKTVIPEQGTIELDVYINNGYAYDYFNPYDRIDSQFDELKTDYHQTENYSIMSTQIHFMSETKTGIINSAGNIDVRVSGETITFSMVFQNFDSGNNDHLNKITLSGLKKGIWNKIGISYGSEGMKFRLNGEEKSNPFIHFLSNSHRNFQIGYALTSYSVWGTLGSPGSGNRKKNYTGFEGYINSFRTSDKQSDWVITK